MMSAESIALDALGERSRQVDMGWTHSHDARHGALHLFMLAQERMPQMDWIAGELAWVMPSRKDVIQAIALLISAVEVMDENSC
jgi:NADPH-dependent ferric siderophore reductase